MKTRMVDGVMHEEVDWVEMFISNNKNIIHLKPSSKPKKTITELAAESSNLNEDSFREEFPKSCVVYDAIEARLSALEEAAKK